MLFGMERRPATVLPSIILYLLPSNCPINSLLPSTMLTAELLVLACDWNRLGILRLRPVRWVRKISLPSFFPLLPLLVRNFWQRVLQAEWVLFGLLTLTPQMEKRCVYATWPDPLLLSKAFHLHVTMLLLSPMGLESQWTETGAPAACPAAALWGCFIACLGLFALTSPHHFSFLNEILFSFCIYLGLSSTHLVAEPHSVTFVCVSRFGSRWFGVRFSFLLFLFLRQKSS